MELTKDEKLALADILQKQLNALLKDLKGEAKDELFTLNETYGVDRREIKVGGVKVGTVSLTYTKPSFEIKPGEDFRAVKYLDSCGLTKTVPVDNWRESFVLNDNGDIICLETGEIANDLFVYNGSVPKTTMVRINQDEAIKALRPALQGVSVTNLLEA